MPDRSELEVFWKRWLNANAECEQRQDWTQLAEFFAEDATYGWNCGPNDEFIAVGRADIERLALGLEMQGLSGWTYPYQATLIDDRAGMIIGFWKQVADAGADDGTPYEVAGFGASWFGYADGHWAWQRDFFDHGNAGATYLAMMAKGVLSEGMAERINAAMRGERAPGHYRRGEAPAPLWPPVGR
jgi:hypothetical protein